MKPIKESINFHRAKTKEDIKTKIFGFQPGQLVIEINSDLISDRESLYCSTVKIIRDITKSDRDLELLNIGYIYVIGGEPDSFKTYSGLFLDSDRSKNYRSLSKKEMDKIHEALEDPMEKKLFDDKIEYFEFDTNKKALFESANFERGFSDQGIKGKILGIRSGMLFTSSIDITQNPFKKIYLYVESRGKDLCVACFLGSITKADGKFFPRNKELFDMEKLWESEKRLLTKEEMSIVREKMLNQPIEYIEKIKSVTKISPSFLKESIEFGRGKNPKESMKLGAYNDIRNVIKNIREADLKRYLIEDCLPPNFQSIIISDKKIVIEFYSNDFTFSKKWVDKKDYAIELMKEAKVYNYLDPIPKKNIELPWVITFNILDSWQGYFPEGHYFNRDDV